MAAEVPFPPWRALKEGRANAAAKSPLYHETYVHQHIMDTAVVKRCQELLSWPAAIPYNEGWQTLR